ncbi:unnamed protein product [Prunus armeniaca]|uniref:Uncharacterized protein n=1 Tax=Prunus armeniaca TaxID=36596 RepID=A0A6J5Y8I1_PRUAR|nr:unnamed protein product [Prunus armeniaca]
MASMMLRSERIMANAADFEDEDDDACDSDSEDSDYLIPKTSMKMKIKMMFVLHEGWMTKLNGQGFKERNWNELSENTLLQEIGSVYWEECGFEAEGVCGDPDWGD